MPDVNTLRQRISELENDLAAQGKELKEKLEAAQRLLEQRDNVVQHLHTIAESQSTEVAALIEERNELKEAVDRLTTVPLAYGSVIRAYDDGTADVDLHGSPMVVGIIPSIKASDLTLGTLVRINTETNAIVALAPHDDRLGEELALNVIHDDSTALVEDKTGRRSLVRVSPGILSRTPEKGTRVIVSDGILTRIVSDAAGDALGGASAFVLAEMPDVSFDDIVGHDKLIAKIRNKIMTPYEYPRGLADYAQDPEARLLLHGPPGCGKTTIAKAIARDIFLPFRERVLKHAKGNFIAIRGPELHDKWWGETERKVREVLEGAEKLYKLTGVPVVVFLDDCESLLLQRGTSNSSTASMDTVNQFNSLVEGVKRLTGVILILATNRVDLVDTAAAGRMYMREYVAPPDTPEKVAAIVRKHLRSAAIAAGQDPVSDLVSRMFDPSPSNDAVEITFDDSDTETIPLREFISGRLLTDIVRRAKDIAIDRDRTLPEHLRPSGINTRDFLEALEEQLENNDALPTTATTVRSWLSTRNDKRNVISVNALRDKKKREARAKLNRQVDRTVQ